MERVIVKSDRVIEVMKEYLSKKLLGFLMVVALIMYAASFLPAKVAYADQQITKELGYQTVQIKSGESLWSIAKEYYTEECKSMSQYINLIKNCNSLYEDDITAGCYLVVPYYH